MTPTRTRAWEAAAVLAFRRTWAASAAPFQGPVRVVIQATFPARRKAELLTPHASKPDADNVAKSVLDAMVAAGILVDDALAWDVRIYKIRAGTREEAGVRVFVEDAPDLGAGFTWAGWR